MSYADGDYSAVERRVLDVARERLNGLEGRERQAAKNEMFGALYGGTRTGRIGSTHSNTSNPPQGTKVKSTRLALTAAVAIMADAAVHAPTSGVHRSTPNSKRGRRMISPGRDFFPHNMTKEQELWNAAVDEKKRAKLQRKLAHTAAAQQRLGQQANSAQTPTRTGGSAG